jgi:hypothetical protein
MRCESSFSQRRTGGMTLPFFGTPLTDAVRRWIFLPSREIMLEIDGDSDYKK